MANGCLYFERDVVMLNILPGAQFTKNLSCVFHTFILSVTSLYAYVVGRRTVKKVGWTRMASVERELITAVRLGAELPPPLRGTARG